jgi:hypothetical protein
MPYRWGIHLTPESTVTTQVYGIIFNIKEFFVKVKVTLRPTVTRPVSLGVKPHLGSKTMFLLLSDSCGFVEVGRPL